ncbi:hypothetical protein AC1031_011019 [Aphanomyces cochlioides]|nr:hypothetical protein AC1031_011019 [Aphanomyces cochlioides]
MYEINNSFVIMGASSSKYIHSSNDYELVIKCSKELEYILEASFGAQGKGLHEKISAASSQLSPRLVKQMRFLATIRNRLIHERGFDRIPDRERFIQQFEEAANELNQLVQARGGAGGSSCAVM